MSRRKGKGRGRLSAIDLLPDEAAPDIAWAADELLANQRPQTEILVDFNERLAKLRLGPISPSAFNRHSMRIAALTARMRETQEVTRAITERLGPDSGDQLTAGLAVLLKQAIFEARESGVGDAESVMFMAKSLHSIVSAQKVSADVRRAAEAEIQTRLKKAADAVTKVGAERGMTAETIQAIRGQILGVPK